MQKIEILIGIEGGKVKVISSDNPDKIQVTVIDYEKVEELRKDLSYSTDALNAVLSTLEGECDLSHFGKVDFTIIPIL